MTIAPVALDSGSFAPSHTTAGPFWRRTVPSDVILPRGSVSSVSSAVWSVPHANRFSYSAGRTNRQRGKSPLQGVTTTAMACGSSPKAKGWRTAQSYLRWEASGGLAFGWVVKG